MIVYADFVVDFPEFSSLPQARVERAIARATNQLDLSLTNADEMVSYLAAHLLEMQNPERRGGAGGITSMRVEGEYSVSYNSQNAQNSLDLTTYGMEYRRLISSSVEGVIVV